MLTGKTYIQIFDFLRVFIFDDILKRVKKKVSLFEVFRVADGTFQCSLRLRMRAANLSPCYVA